MNYSSYNSKIFAYDDCVFVEYIVIIEGLKMLVTFVKKSCFFFCYVIKKYYFCKVFRYLKYAFWENFFENDLQKDNQNSLEFREHSVFGFQHKYVILRL